MHRSLSFRRVLLVALSLSFLPSSLRAETKEVAQLLPSSTVAFVELQKVDGIVGMILEHPLRAQIESLDEVKQGYRSKEFLQFKTVVAMVEARLEKPWREAVDELTSGGVYAAFDAESEGVVLLVQSANAELPKKVVETFVMLARADANQKGKPDPVKVGMYRDRKGYRIEQNRVIALDNFLMITNKGELAEAIADKILDGDDGKSLATNQRFQKASATRSPESQMWAFLDVQTVRDSGEAEAFYREQTDNPGVELLVGGIISTMRETPYATMSLELQQRHVKLAMATPHDPAWTPEHREFYFGRDGTGRAPKPIQVENTLFTLSTYRDFSEMWLRAGDLFDEKVNDEFAKADSNLSTLFSGKDFGEDILGALHPEVQLIVTEQDFENVLPQPSIKLPSFAIVARLKDPEKMRSELRRTFQSLVGFLNVVGAMQGQPQLDLDMDKDGDKLIVSAAYAAEDDEKDSKDARINFNFSPSVAFNKDVFVLSSTTSLAKELADRAVVQTGASAENTLAQANLQALRGVLEKNREHLIAQNMLEDGNSREEAEKQIEILFSLLKVFKDATLRLTPADDSLEMSFQIQLSENLE